MNRTTAVPRAGHWSRFLYLPLLLSVCGGHAWAGLLTLDTSSPDGGLAGPGNTTVWNGTTLQFTGVSGGVAHYVALGDFVLTAADTLSAVGLNGVQINAANDALIDAGAQFVGFSAAGSAPAPAVERGAARPRGAAAARAREVAAAATPALAAVDRVAAAAAAAADKMPTAVTATAGRPAVAAMLAERASRAEQGSVARPTPAAMPWLERLAAAARRQQRMEVTAVRAEPEPELAAEREAAEAAERAAPGATARPTEDRAGSPAAAAGRALRGAWGLAARVERPETRDRIPAALAWR